MRVCAWVRGAAASVVLTNEIATLCEAVGADARELAADSSHRLRYFAVGMPRTER
jgi:hypothetical protein